MHPGWEIAVLDARKPPISVELSSLLTGQRTRTTRSIEGFSLPQLAAGIQAQMGVGGLR